MNEYNDYIAEAYTLFRGDATEIPTSTDPEWATFLTLMNKAINRWANYDGMFWKELYGNIQDSLTGDLSVSTGITTYAAPTNMRKAGGFVKVLTPDGKVYTSYPIVDIEDVQDLDTNSSFCYFSGNPTSGFTLHLNPEPSATMDGYSFDYIYYKKPTILVDGTSATEMANPYFMVLDAVAQRFLIEQDVNSYTVYKRDAEELLKQMKIDNDSGTWSDPWSLKDNSGTVWGL